MWLGDKKFPKSMGRGKGKDKGEGKVISFTPSGLPQKKPRTFGRLVPVAVPVLGMAILVIFTLFGHVPLARIITTISATILSGVAVLTLLKDRQKDLSGIILVICGLIQLANIGWLIFGR